MQFEKYLNVIDEKQDIFCHISDSLWDNPETCFGEYFAADLITGILEENGFTVTRNVADIPTAFTATYGTGSPSLGILAEYDGLEGMSQVGASAEKESIPGKDKSHGCGHNLFAGGSVAAACRRRPSPLSSPERTEKKVGERYEKNDCHCICNDVNAALHACLCTR